MRTRLRRGLLAVPVALGVITLAGVGLLLTWDLFPRAFPARAHDFLGAFPLAGIALAYLVYQTVRRPAPLEFVKVILLAMAFLFWAANQLWSGARHAILFNDIAIALFVFDVFLAMIGRPSGFRDESLAEVSVERRDQT